MISYGDIFPDLGKTFSCPGLAFLMVGRHEDNDHPQ